MFHLECTLMGELFCPLLDVLNGSKTTEDVDRNFQYQFDVSHQNIRKSITIFLKMMCQSCHKAPFLVKKQMFEDSKNVQPMSKVTCKQKIPEGIKLNVQQKAITNFQNDETCPKIQKDELFQI